MTVFLPLYQTLQSFVAILYNTVESWSATAYHHYPPKNSIECVPRLNFTWNIIMITVNEDQKLDIVKV